VKSLKFEDFFHERLNAFRNEHREEDGTFFFRGFGPAQNAEILSCPEALPPRGIGNPDGTLNLPALGEKRKEAAEGLLSGKGFRVGVYEQLLAALSAEPELLGRCGRVAVVDNNLFSSYYPAAIPADDAERLYRYFQGEDAAPSAGLAVFLDYYGDAFSPDEKHLFTAPLDRCSDEGLKVLPFFAEDQVSPSGGEEPEEEVSVSGGEYIVQKADLLAGKLPGKTVFQLDVHADPGKYQFPVFAGILRAVGLPYSFHAACGFNRAERGSGGRFEPLLRKHWGEGASFRRLKFYRAPDTSRETEELSQGDVIAQIVAQCDAAFSGRPFRDVFITAPTGAGKSLLFQLPALSIAQEHGAVTIVITPLIALMKDQVAQLEEERGVACATFINSTLTFEEREKRLLQIRSGEKSILYLAPELLVSTPLETVTGGRPVGLFVVDEAHIVTSWGKDFRADYWYLGDFLLGLRRKGKRFPVLCLTATAVYGGDEDVVNETVGSLFLRDPLLFLGSVRRENIRFDIRRADLKEIGDGVERYKIKKAAEAVKSYVESGEKALVYCPFVTQVDDIYMALEESVRRKVRKYYGTLEKQSRDEAQNSFRSGGCRVMICTKAFGMGVDVKDISGVYHYAPTGSLADYVQEIGRAARDPALRGCAAADCLPTDGRYVRTLYGVSEMKQYQLREMLRKIDDLRRRKMRRSLFLSPDAFAYLFGGRELENRAKNGLLLLAKDLQARYGYPVLTVRPRAMLMRGFLNVPNKAAAGFEKEYGGAVRRLEDGTKRVLPSRNRRLESDTIVVNSGKIYGVDMPAVWEQHFQDISFSQFNHRFFAGELFTSPTGEIFSPRIRVRAFYSFPFQETLDRLERYCTALSGIFRRFKTGGKPFSAAAFKKELAAAFGEDFDRLEFSNLLLETFVADFSRNVGFRSNRDRIKFVAARKSPAGEMEYRVLNTGYISMPEYMEQLARQCPPDDDGVFQAFIPIGRNGRRSERLRLFALLELLGLASCQMEGGQNMEIFVRVNDPGKAAFLAEEKYTNRVLTEIRRRHRSAQEIMMGFLLGGFSSDERWDIIEDYFLGRGDDVRRKLGLPDGEEPSPRQES